MKCYPITKSNTCNLIQLNFSTYRAPCVSDSVPLVEVTGGRVHIEQDDVRVVTITPTFVIRDIWVEF